MRVCNVDGCPELFPSSEGSRCRTHRKEADKRRGTATQRGYTGRGHQAFRRTVLQRDPICVLCNLQQAAVADHHPHTRRELLALGRNPNDPDHGRGLCVPCHNKHTAATTPGGFNQ